ncbi:Permease of the drug/metabolite transporter (DMT) superfamily [Anaerovirgula multivorans]|uniref:Permease of the drug/metabolite transporter (DMT) superfamily n=1 Tax=Anaerovirgula multivorans TaxID=312168 RepID=A0A239GBV1_9FIRM|nr:DMT family transporter [Anaerovirgula multivorans]SNS66647.1 Permease of the drug/metabolite transporter (DMT) superfamily [Anaerovirgula multivorans]
MSKQLKADLALLGVTIIWGSSFILSKNSLDHLETFNFLAIRFLISALLSSIIFYKNMIHIQKDTLKYGIFIGIILFTGYAFQTVGLNYTTASKSGFITGFCVVIVPVLSALLLKQKPERAAVIGVILALVGLGFLTLDSSLSLNIGDFLTLIGALMFALHIITVGKYTVSVDSIALGIVQIAVVGILSLLFTVTIETPIIPKGVEVWTSILILAVLATSVAFIVQNAMQKFTSATHTALIYTGEPVFSALFAYILAGEILTKGGIFGGILILLGMMIAELDWKNIFARKKKLQSS